MLYFAVWRLNARKIISAIVGICLLGFLVVQNIIWLNAQTVSVLSWAVANKVIVVDPGHGGVDPGAIGQGGTKEKNITLAIGQRLSEYLAHGGAMVVMTRNEDKDLGRSKALRQRKREDLEARYRIVKDNQADLYINLQVNSFVGKCPPGSQTFYYRGNAEGKLLAEHIQNELRRIMLNTQRQPLPLDIYMLRNVETSGVVIEVGFLSNPTEERMLADKTYQSKIAYAIYSGIVRHLADERAQVVLKEMR
jgi:N-acetylmuramoyl-L-alanine amidase